MSKVDPRAKKPLRLAWSVHFDQADFYLDEPISGYIELVVQDVYMASTIKVNLMQFVTVTVSDKYAQNLALFMFTQFASNHLLLRSLGAKKSALLLFLNP